MTFWNRLTVIWVVLNLVLVVAAFTSREPSAYLALGVSAAILGLVLVFRAKFERTYRR